MTDQTESALGRDEKQRAIEVLRGTDDGDALSPGDLGLLQLVVNEGLAGLSRKGAERWEEICRAVASGTYQNEWFHGVENLTQDHSGYVKWRGKTVEHFSYPSERVSEERIAAQMLGRVCTRLERDNVAVRSSEVMRFYSHMRFGGELGPSVLRRAVIFRAGSTTGLDMKVHPLTLSTDADLSREMAGILDSINMGREGQGSAHVSGLPLITKEDYDVVVAAITNAAEWGRGMAWRAGSLTPTHGLYNEPSATLKALESQVPRSSLIDEAAVQIHYLGASFAEPPPEVRADTDRPRVSC